MQRRRRERLAAAQYAALRASGQIRVSRIELEFCALNPLRRVDSAHCVAVIARRDSGQGEAAVEALQQCRSAALPVPPPQLAPVQVHLPLQQQRAGLSLQALVDVVVLVLSSYSHSYSLPIAPLPYTRLRQRISDIIQQQYYLLPVANIIWRQYTD